MMAHYEHPTGEQIRAVIDEVNASFPTDEPEQWQIYMVEHLTGPGFPEGVYTVQYTNGVKHVVLRNEATGRIEHAQTWTYWAIENFEDTHGGHTKKEAGDSEE